MLATSSRERAVCEKCATVIHVVERANAEACASSTMVGSRKAVLALHALKQGRDERSHSRPAQNPQGDAPRRSHIPEISMKPAQKRKTKRATRRVLFGELVEGMTALAEAREGKRTLRTHHL